LSIQNKGGKGIRGLLKVNVGLGQTAFPKPIAQIVQLGQQKLVLLPNISDDCSIRLAHLWNLSLNEDTAFHPLRLSNYNVTVRGLYA
jgi:hypothetical protein